MWLGSGLSGLFSSTDGGASWQPASLGSALAVADLSLDAAGRIYAGTSRGVFQRLPAELFADGFETGDLSAWEVVVP